MNPSRRYFIRVAGGVIAAGLIRPSFAAEPEAPKPAAMFTGPIKTHRLDDDLYVLFGAGGNTSVLFDANHLLVIDSGIPPRGAELLGLATKFAPQATSKTLFNTHYHFDHTGGNPAFVDAGYVVVGSANCRARMGQTIVFEDMARTMEPSPENARPTITFEQGLKLYSPLEVQITKVAPAHTDTDAAVFIASRNTLITGDLHFSGLFPVIDRSTGGSLDGITAATKLLLTMGDEKTRVVPGHGVIGDKTAIRAQLELLNVVHDRLAPLGEKKMTMEEAVTAAPLADLDEKWGRGFVRSPLFTRMAYGQWVTKGK